MAQSELQAGAIVALRQNGIQTTKDNTGAAIELLRAGLPSEMITTEYIKYAIAKFEKSSNVTAIRLSLVEDANYAIAARQDAMQSDIYRIDRDIQELRNSRNSRSNSSHRSNSDSGDGIGLITILGLIVFASIGTMLVFNYAVHNFTRVRVVSPAPPQQQSY